MKVIIGIILLIGALVLSYISSTNGEAMMTKKDALVTKYVDASKTALDSGDIKGAIKNAKNAIKADPQSKKGFTAYSNALEKEFKPADTSSEEDSEQAPAQAAPSSLAPSYDDDDMGC